MQKALRLLVLAMVAAPALTPAQKKEDILEIQRDISSVDEKVKALQKSQSDSMDALRQMLQQAVAASSTTSQELAALQKSLGTTLTNGLADQQAKVSQTVGSLVTEIDALTKSVDQLNQTLAQMNGRLNTVDTKLRDISDKVSTINQPPPAPPPAPGAPEASSNGAPPGVTRTALRNDAERDYDTGYYDNAIKEFSNFIKYFPDDEYAPSAGYYMGMSYLQQKDYENAAQALQKVMDTWPSHNRAQDALFQKGIALESGGHKADAVTTLKEFISKYPANDYNQKAKQELAKLTAAKQPAGKRGPVK